MYKFGVFVVLLAVSVGDVLCVCTGTSKTFAVGELKLGKGKAQCENTEEVTGVTKCTGTCDSSVSVVFEGGKKPKFDRDCNCCKLQMEETEVKLSCSKDGGEPKDVTKKIKMPQSCSCDACAGKKGGKKGGKGKGGKGRRNED